MREIEFDQATYGEKDGGHKLLSTSLDAKVATSISSRLDLPDQMPPSVVMQDYFTGFPIEGHYVLARVSSDPLAKRHGMVFSHAIFLSKRLTVDVNEIADVLGALKARPSDVGSEISTVKIDVDQNGSRSDPKFPTLATRLLEARSQPVVLCSDHNQEEIVASLWRNLWPEVRASFVFRLSLGPNDIHEKDGVHLVFTPRETLNRWSPDQIVDDPSAPISNPTPLVRMLTGESVDELRSFLLESGIPIEDFRTLAHVGQAYSSLAATERTFADLLRAGRIIGMLAPDPSSALVVKRHLIKEMIAKTADCTVLDVLSLRNFSTAPFDESDNFWRSIEDFVQGIFSSGHVDYSFRDVLADAVATERAIVEDWQNSILSGYQRAIKSATKSVGKSFWAVCTGGEEFIEALLEQTPTSKTIDRTLADSFVDLDVGKRDGPESTAPFCRRFLITFAVVVNQREGPESTLRKLVALDKSKKIEEPVQRILSGLTGKRVIQLALKIDSRVMIGQAAEKVSMKPDLIRDISFEDRAAQEIWSESLARNPETWSAPADPVSTFHNILDETIHGGNVSDALLVRLADSPLANLIAYSSRDRIWDVLPKKVVDKYLAATADGWISELLNNGVLHDPDPALTQLIGSQSRLNDIVVGLHRLDLMVAIQVFSTIDNLSSSHFISYLSSMLRGHSLNEAEVGAVGHLIVAKEWRSVVSYLAFHYGLRGDVRPVLHIAADYLTFIEKIGLGIYSPPANEFFDTLTTTCIELYPEGPSQSELWSRSGGDNADLPAKETGRTQWHRAIALIRNGGTVTIRSLLAEMTREFPNNSEIRYLGKVELE